MLVTIKYCLFPPSRSQNWKLRPREEGIPSAFWGGSHEGPRSQLWEDRSPFRRWALGSAGGLSWLGPPLSELQFLAGRDSLSSGQLRGLAVLFKGWSYREEHEGKTLARPGNSFLCFWVRYSCFTCPHAGRCLSLWVGQLFLFPMVFKAQPSSETSQSLLISSLWLWIVAACFMCPQITRLLQNFKTRSLIQKHILNLLVPS